MDSDISPCRTGSSMTSGDLGDISSLSSKASSLQHSSGGTSGGFTRPDLIMPPSRGAFRYRLPLHPLVPLLRLPPVSDFLRLCTRCMSPLHPPCLSNTLISQWFTDPSLLRVQVARGHESGGGGGGEGRGEGVAWRSQNGAPCNLTGLISSPSVCLQSQEGRRAATEGSQGSQGRVSGHSEQRLRHPGVPGPRPADPQRKG